MSENLTPRKRRALAALLTEPTVKAAATRAGVSRETVYKYLGDSEFQAALAVAQSSALRGVVARLVGLLGRALDVLATDLTPATPDIGNARQRSLWATTQGWVSSWIWRRGLRR